MLCSGLASRFNFAYLRLFRIASTKLILVYFFSSRDVQIEFGDSVSFCKLELFLFSSLAPRGVRAITAQAARGTPVLGNSVISLGSEVVTFGGFPSLASVLAGKKESPRKRAKSSANKLDFDESDLNIT